MSLKLTENIRKSSDQIGRRDSKMFQRLWLKKFKNDKIQWRECTINFHVKAIDQDNKKEKNRIDMTNSVFGSYQ